MTNGPEEKRELVKGIVTKEDAHRDEVAFQLQAELILAWGGYTNVTEPKELPVLRDSEETGSEEA